MSQVANVRANGALWRKPNWPGNASSNRIDAADVQSECAATEHPPWCTRHHPPGDSGHASSVHTIQHGSSTIDVSLRDYGLDTGIVVSVDISTELDSLVLDLSPTEAIGLYGAFSDLLDTAPST